VAKWFMIFPAIVVIILVCNEFEYKTLRQGVINGLSRTEMLLSKLILVLFLSLGVALFEVLLILILGLLKSSSPHGSMFDGVQYVLVYFIQVFCFLSFAGLVAFLLKRTGLAISLVILYYLIIEPIIGHFMGNSGDYLPLNLITGLNPNPLLNHFGIAVDPLSAIKIILALVYWLVFQGLILLLLTVRDL
jgi:ABC-type transport system involved in multi-copper enzyme maturation permease subunit